MPIYEYRCQACDHIMDALQKISDDPLVDCPECGGAALKRLISAPAFRLKGSGWYETDFKTDKDKKRNLADGAKSSAATASEDKKAESKKPDKASAKPKSGSGTEAA